MDAEFGSPQEDLMPAEGAMPDPPADEMAMPPMEPEPPPSQPGPGPTPKPALPQRSYIVVNGDSLWLISGKPLAFSDNFRWPLIFKSNRDQIIDPDLIEPGQKLAWKQYYPSREVDDAVRKARETPPYVPHSSPRKSLPIDY
jgi:nucleoid-associated protein YgaU